MSQALKDRGEVKAMKATMKFGMKHTMKPVAPKTAKAMKKKGVLPKVEVRWMSGKLVCHLLEICVSSEEGEIMDQIRDASGLPAMAQVLCIGNRKFTLKDVLDERNPRSFVKALVKMENPMVQLVQRKLVDAMYDRPGLLFEDAQGVDADEARCLLDKGFVGAILQFVTTDVDDVEDFYNHESAVFALKHVLGKVAMEEDEEEKEGQEEDAKPYIKELKDGTQKLREIVYSDDWPLGVCQAAGEILSKYLGVSVTVPDRAPDLRYVSVENGGSWNPGRYDIMPDECM